MIHLNFNYFRLKVVGAVAAYTYIECELILCFCELRQWALSWSASTQTGVLVCQPQQEQTQAPRYAFQHSNGKWCSEKDLPIERWHRTTVHNETTWQLIRFVGLRLLLGCTTNAFGYRLKLWMPVIAFEVIRTTFRSANWIFSFFLSRLSRPHRQIVLTTIAAATFLRVDQFTSFRLLELYLSESGRRNKTITSIKFICFDKICDTILSR